MAQEASAAAAAGVEQPNGASKAVVGFASFKPKLVVPAAKADEAVKFYKAAFGAEEVERVNYPKRKAEQELPHILCAELKIGSASFLVCDQADDAAPVKNGGGGDGVIFQLETEHVKEAVAKAVEAGGVLDGGEIAAAEEVPGGVTLKDPIGQVWAISLPGKKCAGEAEA